MHRRATSYGDHMEVHRLGGRALCALLLVVGGTQVLHGTLVVGATQADASTTGVSGNPTAVAYAELVAAATQRMGAEEETIPGQEAIDDYVKGQAWNVTTKFVVGSTMPTGYVATVEYTTIAATSVVGIDRLCTGRLPDAEGADLHEDHRQHHGSVPSHERRVFHSSE